MLSYLYKIYLQLFIDLLTNKMPDGQFTNLKKGYNNILIYNSNW